MASSEKTVRAPRSDAASPQFASGTTTWHDNQLADNRGHAHERRGRPAHDRRHQRHERRRAPPLATAGRHDEGALAALRRAAAALGGAHRRHRPRAVRRAEREGAPRRARLAHDHRRRARRGARRGARRHRRRLRARAARVVRPLAAARDRARRQARDARGRSVRPRRRAARLVGRVRVRVRVARRVRLARGRARAAAAAPRRAAPAGQPAALRRGGGGGGGGAVVDEAAPEPRRHRRPADQPRVPRCRSFRWRPSRSSSRARRRWRCRTWWAS